MLGWLSASEIGAGADSDLAAAEETAASVREAGGIAQAVRADVTQIGELKGLAAAAISVHMIFAPSAPAIDLQIHPVDEACFVAHPGQHSLLGCSIDRTMFRGTPS